MNIVLINGSPKGEKSCTERLLEIFKTEFEKENSVYEIYIANKDGAFTRIDELTTKCLREGHNIMRMYIAGSFRMK